MQTPKPCLNCGRVTTNGSRCPECGARHEAGQEARRVRGTRTERGYGNDWLRISREAIRLQPWCSICFATGDLTGDHIVPKKSGGGDDPRNVRVLCRACNSRKGAK
jgi:5-methylcytosine-specific restriction protein A